VGAYNVYELFGYGPPIHPSDVCWFVEDVIDNPRVILVVFGNGVPEIRGKSNVWIERIAMIWI
jgi:hypothetical protein